MHRSTTSVCVKLTAVSFHQDQRTTVYTVEICDTRGFVKMKKKKRRKTHKKTIDVNNKYLYFFHPNLFFSYSLIYPYMNGSFFAHFFLIFQDVF